MTVRIGSLSTVERRSLGGTVVADALAGASSLVLDLVSDFDEDGGSVMVGETALTYTAADFDSDTLTLSAPLAADVPADTPALSLTSDGQEEVEWIAAVDLGDDEDGDAVSATIPTALVGYFVEGSDQAGMLVEVEGTAEGWRVRSQPTQVPELDASVIQSAHGAYYRTSDSAALGSGTWHPVTGLTTQSASDLIGAMDTSTGYVEIQQDGRYLLVSTQPWQPNTNNARVARFTTLDIDGVTTAVISPEFRDDPSPDSGNVTVLAVWPVHLAAGVKVRAEAWQNSAASLYLRGGASGAQTAFSITYLGP